jgi:hypothetical protein
MFAASPILIPRCWVCRLLEDDDEYENDYEGRDPHENLDVYLNCSGRILDFVKRLL